MKHKKSKIILVFTYQAVKKLTTVHCNFKVLNELHCSILPVYSIIAAHTISQFWLKNGFHKGKHQEWDFCPEQAFNSLMRKKVQYNQKKKNI